MVYIFQRRRRGRVEDKVRISFLTGFLKIEAILSRKRSLMSVQKLARILFRSVMASSHSRNCNLHLAVKEVRSGKGKPAPLTHS